MLRRSRPALERTFSRLWLGVAAWLVGTAPLAAQQTHFSNPILPGDWSDPGVVRVGDTYYSVRSTFGWQPGLLIAASRDLVHWSYAGNVDLSGVPEFRDGETAWGAWGSEIVWNPNTRKFLVYSPVRESDHFVAWQADSPAGPWDGPYHIAYAIDPGVFVDDVRDEQGNFRIYASFAAEGVIYELTPDGLRLRDPGRVYGPRIEDHTSGAEGPEILKRDGWYYLIYSTGGTLPWEAYNIQTARTRDLRNGPWEFDPANPQLLANSYTYAPLQGPGHGELLQMPDGAWYATHHGFEITHYSLGRQTALTPIEWTVDGWWRPRHGQIPLPSAPRPALPWSPRRTQASDEFAYPSNRALGLQWFWNQAPVYDGSPWSVVERPGWLRIRTQPGDIASPESRANVFLQRVTHKRFDVTTRLDFEARQEGEAAGLHFYHDPRQSFWLISTRRDDQPVFEVGRYWWDADERQARRETLWRAPNRLGREVELRIRVDGEETATFWAGDGSGEWTRIGESVYFGDSGRDRRAGVAGKPDLGWVGQWTRGNNRWTAATFGVFAVRDGAPVSGTADFDFLRVATHPYIDHPRPTPGDVAAEPAFRFARGAPISVPLAVHGGTAPYRWTASGLLVGLTLDAATGLLRSTDEGPAVGSYRFQVAATDAAGESHTRPILLEVADRPMPAVDCSREHRESVAEAALPATMRQALRRLRGDEPLSDPRTARIVTCGAYRELPYTVYETTGVTPTRSFMLRALEDGTILDNQTKPRSAPSAPTAIAPEVMRTLRGAVDRTLTLGEEYPLGRPRPVRTTSGETAYRVDTRAIGRIHSLLIAQDGRVLERWERRSFFDLPTPARAMVALELGRQVNPWLEIWQAGHAAPPAFRVEVRDASRSPILHLHFDERGSLLRRSPVTQEEP